MKTHSLIPLAVLAFVLASAPARAQVELMDRSKAPVADSATVLLLHFDEGSGRIVKDSSRHGNHGKILGNAEWVPGVFGKALRFDGQDKAVDCEGERSRPPDFDFGDAKDFTVEFWVNTTTKARYAHLVNKKCNPSATEAGWMVFLHLGLVKAMIADGQNSINLINLAPVADGNWHHVALVVERKGDAVIYVDGAGGEPLSMKGILDVTNTRRTLRIGDRAHDDALEGMIDEIRISTVARKLKP
jgi:hypothetical protein